MAWYRFPLTDSAVWQHLYYITNTTVAWAGVFWPVGNATFQQNEFNFLNVKKLTFKRAKIKAVPLGNSTSGSQCDTHTYSTMAERMCSKIVHEWTL